MHLSRNLHIYYVQTSTSKNKRYVSQGKITVPSIDDREDMQFANEAFDILGFTEEEKYNV